MTLENLFDSALPEAELLPRTRLTVQRSERSSGYLVVGLQTRDFLDIALYRASFTDLCKPASPFHDNGVVHDVVRAHFCYETSLSREIVYSGNVDEKTARKRLADARSCGYDLPSDLITAVITSTDERTIVSLPFELLQPPRSGRIDYVQRTSAGVLLVPCPTVYYATSRDEAQEAAQLLKEQVRRFR